MWWIHGSSSCPSGPGLGLAARDFAGHMCSGTSFWILFSSCCFVEIWLALWIWLLCVMIYFIWAIELNSSGNNFATDLKLSQWLRTKCSGFPSQPRTFAFLSLCNVKLCTEVSTFTKNNICTPHTSENRPAGSVNVCSYIGIYVFNIGSTFDSI